VESWGRLSDGQEESLTRRYSVVETSTAPRIKRRKPQGLTILGDFKNVSMSQKLIYE